MNRIKKYLFKKYLQRYYRNNIKNTRIGRIQTDSFRIIDETYGALWDKPTGELIRRRTQLFNEVSYSLSTNDKIRFMEDIHKAIVRKYNDQTLDKYHSDLPIPLDATYKRDRITFNGVTRIWSKFSGSSELPPTHIAVGHGVSETVDDQSALENQDAIESLTGNGSMQPSGAVLRFQATFDILEPTFNMSEVGIFAGSPGGLLLARTLFDDPLQHEYGENYPSADYAIHTLAS